MPRGISPPELLLMSGKFRLLGRFTEERGENDMKLTFIGADHEVTGSCHYLEVGKTKILIDCGIEQGNNPYQNA